VTTTSLVLQQAAALLASLLASGGVLYLAVLGCSAVFGMGIGASGLLAATLATVGLAVEFGWLVLAVGAFTGRRGVAVARPPGHAADRCRPARPGPAGVARRDIAVAH
jgi:ABC-2 type transport system permease protein